MTRICRACGATGRVLPPDFGYERDDHVPLVEWSGGELGDGRVAFEPSSASADFCPGCRERPAVYVVRSPTGRSG